LEVSVTKFISSLATATAVLAFGLAALPASALSTRTFVSATGADSGACTRAAPCRMLSYAHTQTSPGGEIDILDTAGYGALTITKSISIVNPGGVEAGILASAGGNAITIAAGTNDVISLRGLTLEGAGSGAVGIKLTSGGHVTILDSVVRGFTSEGINISPSSLSTTFHIANTLVSHNSVYGIKIAPSGTGTVDGSMDHIATNRNGDTGIHVSGALTTGVLMNVSITNSVISGNGSVGVKCDSAASHATTQVIVINSSVTHNGIGVITTGPANVPAAMWVGSSSVSFNGTGFNNVTGSTERLLSYGNNVVAGNVQGEAFGIVDHVNLF
jgi:hypothetical protein